MPDVKTVVADPEFHSLPYEERRKVLKTIDPDFAGLPALEQEKALNGIAKMFSKSEFNAPELAPSHAPTQPLPQPHPRAVAVAPYYRAGLEGVGAALGTMAGMAGGPAAPIAAPILGGAGFAGGKAIADRLDEWQNIRHERGGIDKYLDPAGEFMDRGSAAEVATRPLRDTATAAAMAGPAEGIALGFSKATGALKGFNEWLGRALGREPAIEKKAGEVLSKHTSVGEYYPKNVEEARAIETEINTGIKEGEPVFKFTLGQRSFDPNQIKLERTQVLRAGTGPQLAKDQEAQNIAALQNYLERKFSGEVGAAEVKTAAEQRAAAYQANAAGKQQAADTTAAGISTKEGQTAGGELLDQIETAKEPVRQAMNELKAGIPDYPMKLDKLKSEIDLIKKDKTLDIYQRRAIEDFEKNDLPDLVKNGETTLSAMGINRTLGNKAAELKEAGKKDIANIFDRLRKNGIQKDIESVSELARTGKIVEYGGKTIDADRLSAELESNLKQLAEMRNATKVDVDALKKGIQDAGGRARMQVVKEDNQQYIENLAKDYKNLTGKEPPTMPKHSPQALKDLETRNDMIRTILSDVSPGQDVAATMKAYNQYASENWFGKFRTGAVESATRQGNQATGTKLRIEQVPAQFKTPQGADDLINAIGADQARETMRGNFAYDLLQSATNPQTKEVTSKGLATWLSRNREVLTKYGLQNEFTGLQKAQAAADAAKEAAKEFEKSALGRVIGVDPDKIVGTIISGNSTGKQTAELLKSLQGDKAAINGLKNAFADYINTQAETTWKTVAQSAQVSPAKFERMMAKAKEASRVLFQDEPDKLKALEVVQKAHQFASRNTRSPVGSGSDTYEKIADAANQGLLGKTLSSIGGWKSTIAKKCFSVIQNTGQEKVNEVILKAVFDPEYAYTLVRASRGQMQPEAFSAKLSDITSKVIDMNEWQQARAMPGGLSGKQVRGGTAARVGSYAMQDND